MLGSLPNPNVGPSVGRDRRTWGNRDEPHDMIKKKLWFPRLESTIFIPRVGYSVIIILELVQGRD